MSLLKINDLCKEFEGVTPLKNINLTVEQGEIISIIGPSWSVPATSAVLRDAICEGLGP